MRRRKKINKNIATRNKERIIHKDSLCIEERRKSNSKVNSVVLIHLNKVHSVNKTGLMTV